MSRKKIYIILATFLVIIGLITYYINYNPYKGTNLGSIYDLVKIQHFDKGTYNDYKELFTNSNSILSEDQFNSYRKDNKPEAIFKYGASSPKCVMKHMKAIKADKEGKVYRIYYLKDINDTKEIDKLSYWMVENKNGNWLIKN